MIWMNFFFFFWLDNRRERKIPWNFHWLSFCLICPFFSWFNCLLFFRHFFPGSFWHWEKKFPVKFFRGNFLSFLSGKLFCEYYYYKIHTWHIAMDVDDDKATNYFPKKLFWILKFQQNTIHLCRFKCVYLFLFSCFLFLGWMMDIIPIYNVSVWFVLFVVAEYLCVCQMPKIHNE